MKQSPGFSQIDLPHQSGSEPDWQESVVLIFDDPDAGLCGFIRVGGEPNLRLSQLHCHFASYDGLRFRANLADMPMQQRDRRADGFAAGFVHWSLPALETLRLIGDDRDIAFDLTVKDACPSTAWQPGDTNTMNELAQGHVESAALVSGWVRIGDRSFVLNSAAAMRDHSWGRRDTSVVRSFRWAAGTTGADFAFSLNIAHLSNGVSGRAGWVYRDGITTHCSDVDVVAWVNSDGLTVRGGEIQLKLPDGETIQLQATLIDGFITGYRSDCGGQVGKQVGVEGLCRIEYRGQTGFCDLNVCNNPSGGERTVVEVCEAYATLRPGVSKRP